MSSEPPNSRREWRLRLALLTFSAALVFLVGEVALRILERGAPKPVASESGFTFFTHDDQLGWDLVPGAVDRHEAAEFSVEIRIDEDGLRSAMPSTAVTDSSRQLVVLGDSFTFGHGVEASEAWPALLEQRLPNVAPRNLAVTGYGTDQQLLRFEERAPGLRPDAVVLGLFAGNVFRNARFEQLGYSKPRFSLEGGELKLLGVPVPDAPPAPPASRLGALLAGTLRTVTEHLGYGEAWSVTGGIVDRLVERAAEQGAPVFVVILPKDQMIYGGGPRRSVHERMHAKLHELLDERGVAYLDLTAALRLAAADPAAADPAAAASDGARLYFPKDGHWTREGHRVAADAVAAWLEPLLPAPPDSPVSETLPTDPPVSDPSPEPPGSDS